MAEDLVSENAFPRSFRLVETGTTAFVRSSLFSIPSLSTHKTTHFYGHHGQCWLNTVFLWQNTVFLVDLRYDSGWFKGTIWTDGTHERLISHPISQRPISVAVEAGTAKRNS